MLLRPMSLRPEKSTKTQMSLRPNFLKPKSIIIRILIMIKIAIIIIAMICTCHYETIVIIITIFFMIKILGGGRGERGH